MQGCVRRGSGLLPQSMIHRAQPCASPSNYMLTYYSLLIK